MSLINRFKHILLPLVITIILLLVWLVPPATNWFHAFVKLEPMRLPYTIIFFCSLFFMLFIYYFFVANKSLLQAFIWGALFGQLDGTVSIFIANLFIKNGVSRTLNTIVLEGFSILSLDFVVAFVLGGWLFGAIAFVTLKIFSSRKGKGVKRERGQILT